MESALLYKIQAMIPESHCFDIQCFIPQPDPKGQIFSLPNWIPGSYTIRNFSKHIVEMKAFSDNREITVTQLDKSTWRCAKVTGSIVIHYRIFAADLSPRGAYVDTTRAFFNGSRVFIKIHQQEATLCQLELLPPKEIQFAHWQVGTTMPRMTALLHQFGLYAAKNYEELIDHPVEMGQFIILSFKAAGISHEILLTGQYFCDTEKLIKDVKSLCEYHLKFFGFPLPFPCYTFLITVLADGYGGLEHRSSSVIHCSRDMLPKTGQLVVSEGYRSLLGLLSHEYFHAWQVKKITPAVFQKNDLTTENYTRQLWIFEGITSYYDDLALVRSGILTIEEYFIILSEMITRFWANKGRHCQTLEAASLEAWTKFYQPDENAPNATVSYYVKGAIVALLLDLKIRTDTNCRLSLDDVMIFCWTQYQINGKGLEEGEFEEIVSNVTGIACEEFFEMALRSTKELPIETILSELGLNVIVRRANSSGSDLKMNGLSPVPSLGIVLDSRREDACIQNVIENEAASLVGLAVGDCIIAIDDIKVNRSNLYNHLTNYKIGDTVTLHLFRRDILMVMYPTLKAVSHLKCTIQTPEIIMLEKEQYLRKWLLG